MITGITIQFADTEARGVWITDNFLRGGPEATEYLAADAVLIRRSVEIAGVREASAPFHFSLLGSYPIQFDPSTWRA